MNTIIVLLPGQDERNGGKTQTSGEDKVSLFFQIVERNSFIPIINAISIASYFFKA